MLTQMQITLILVDSSIVVLPTLAIYMHRDIFPPASGVGFLCVLQRTCFIGQRDAVKMQITALICALIQL